MFVYESNNKVNIVLDGNKPAVLPDYTLDMVGQELVVNNAVIAAPEKRVLEADLVLETADLISASVSVNLNGKTISAPEDTAGDGIFHVVAGGNLTISGNGVIDAVGNNDYSMAIWADGGSVVINGGEFTNIGARGNDTSTDTDHYDLIYVKKGGSVEINGGSFKCETPRWTLNSHNTEVGTFSVKGGRFYKFNPAVAMTDDLGTNPHNYVADGYTVVADGDWFTVVRAQSKVQ